MADLTEQLARLSAEQRARLASLLRHPAPGVVPVPRQGGSVPLSFTQERIWFLEQFNPGTAFRNMSGVARIPVPVDPEMFTDCVNAVAARHDILRTRFDLRDGEPVGLVADKVSVPVRVLGELPKPERERLFQADATRPFDLRTAPLLRVTIAPDGAATFVQLTMHHIISDGFSTGVFFREFGELYRLRLAGIRAGLPPLPFQFADVAAWERREYGGQRQAGSIAYWSRHLEGAPQRLTLPEDYPRPARMTYRGKRLPVQLSADLVEQVRSLSQRHGVTPFVTALTAFTVALSEYASQDDLIVGVPVANREQRGVEQLIGPFLNTLALRFDLTGDPSFAELSQRVNRTFLAGLDHQEVPFERVLQAVQDARDPSRSPLFQVVFNFQTDQAAAGTPGSELQDLHNGGSDFDLLFNIVSTADGMSAHVDYYADVYREATIAGIVAAFQAVLRGDRAVGRNRLPSPQELTEPELPRANRFVAPRTETEQAIAAIWRDLLDLPEVGVEDNFFELGGHSLLATKLVFRIHDVLGADLPLTTLFEDEPTIARLAVLVTDGAAAEAADQEFLDLGAEARLADDIRPRAGAHVHSVRHPQHIFLTGATGFVGAFLLAELLRTTQASVFCLVRAASVADGQQRIRDAMAEYGIWDPSLADRVIPVLGTLSQRRFGFSKPQWQHLAAMTDVIYHCGAEVNFLRKYHALKPANVLGTEEVLRLACDGSVKPVHFVSTIYVFSRFSYPPGTEFYEDMEPVHDLNYTFGYTQSKWVSEQLAFEAGRRGVPVYVYRLGRVAGHSKTGACQNYDFVWQVTKVGIEMAAAPIMDMTLDVTPVDYVVSALAHLSRQPDLAGRAFHLLSPVQITEPEFVAWLERYGYAGQRLTFSEWCQRVVRRAAELSDRTAGALAPFLSGTLPLDRMPAAHFDQANVERGLAGSMISCPPMSEELLRTYLDYFRDSGYLPPPPAHTDIAPADAAQAVGEGQR